MEQRENNAEYSPAGLKCSNLDMLPRETRMTFQDVGDGYSRLDAMKVAKEQAQIREKAAEYCHAGQDVPAHLWQKYEKAMDVKLGQRWGSKARSKVAERISNASEHAATPATVLTTGSIPQTEVPPLRLPSAPIALNTQPDLFKIAGILRPDMIGGG
jgi:hypothetical protein